MPTLAQELLLLALDDDRGPAGEGASSTLDTALAGAALMDLALAGKVRIQDSVVYVTTGKGPLRDEVLDDTLERIRSQPGPRQVERLIPKLALEIREPLLEQLVGAGALITDEHRVLGLFTRSSHPVADPGAEEELRRRLRSAVLDGSAADERTAVLAAVIEAAGLQSLLLSREERRSSRGSMAEAGSAEGLSPVLARSVSAHDTAAAIAAATASSVAACSASDSSSPAG